MTNLAKLSIREIQQIHAISGEFFLEHGIDPETMGHLTPVELCLLEEFNLAQLIRAMKKEIADEWAESSNFSSWPSDLLTRYIEATHHSLIRQQTPQIQKRIKALKAELPDEADRIGLLESLFFQSSEELIHHMAQEELIIFPFIRNLSQFPEKANLLLSPPFDRIAGQIEKLIQDHESEDRLFEQIKLLTNEYQTIPSATSSYNSLMKELSAFHLDLKTHIDLEQNILFPRVIAFASDYSFGPFHFNPPHEN